VRRDIFKIRLQEKEIEAEIFVRRMTTRKMSPGDGLVRESDVVIEIITHISATDNEQWHRECQGFIVEEDVSGGAGTHGDCYNVDLAWNISLCYPFSYPS